MKVAPFRALTQLPPDQQHLSVHHVEMKVAPFRALTQFIKHNFVDGIMVEMKVAPFRALTQKPDKKLPV